MTSETGETFNYDTNRRLRRAIIWLTSLLILILLNRGVRWLMHRKSPILVGVSITLTGPEASVGRSVLNGVRMVVDEQNAAGGIRGHQVELLVKDDADDPDLAIRNDMELLETEVVAIWGHVPSRVSEPAVDAMASVYPYLLDPAMGYAAN